MPNNPFKSVVRYCNPFCDAKVTNLGQSTNFYRKIGCHGNSLEQPKKGSDQQSMIKYGENLVKIGPVVLGIILLKGLFLKINTSRTCIAHGAGLPCGLNITGGKKQLNIYIQQNNSLESYRAYRF